MQLRTISGVIPGGVILKCYYNIQVVNNEHLLLYCRGNGTSFSAHVMRLTDNSGNACVVEMLLLVGH